MTHWRKILIMLGLVVALAACGGAKSSEEPISPSAAAGTPVPADTRDTAALVDDYEDALSIRNQLAYGTLRLEGTTEAITAQQAAQLLPFWQAMKTLSSSSTSATEEVTAVQNQIMAALTSDQLGAIAALRLTNAALQEYYIEIGVAEVKTPEPGVTPQSSSLKDLPPEQREAARATAQALGTPVGGGSSGSLSDKRDVLLDNVIELLTNRAAGK